MEQKWYMAIILLLSAILIGLIILYTKGAILSPPVSLEECKTLKYSGENAVNLVFFADKATTEKYMKAFFQISPFNKAPEGFNFYYIDTYTPQCEIYKGIALLCYNKELLKKAASCPNDFIMAVKNDIDSSIRSASYMNVISINGLHSINVFQHEFGHSFAQLSDEYVPAVLPRSSQNCVASCDKFQESTDGCFGGCAEDNYFRSIDYGVMRTLGSSNYGKLDEALIIQKIQQKGLPITGLATAEERTCVKEKYTLVRGTYTNGLITINDKNIQQGCLGTSGSGVFTYSLELSSGSNLTGTEFNPELIFTDVQNEATNEITGGPEQKEGDFYLKIPVIENARTLHIRDANNISIAELTLEDLGARPCRI